MLASKQLYGQPHRHRRLDRRGRRPPPGLHRRARTLRYTDAGAGLTSSELTTLFAIARSGPIGLSELAAQQRLNPTMLSRIAGKLCEAGLIARTTAPDDRRAALVDVTAAGRRRFRAIQAERTASLTRHVEALAPQDAAALLAALPALEALGAVARDGRG
jgi:DNA-binding MarR family transcriptional regulator